MRRLATLLFALLCLSALCAVSHAGSEPAISPTRIAFSPGGLGVRPGDVAILSSHVYDYTFADAPADWTPCGGLWTTTNRWTCSPQWSWYGGHNANGIAAIWNKHEFVGDVTVEAYLAFKMGVGVVYQTRSYKNPANMCLTLAGDGADPASGYSFIIGADKDTDTRIMKGTKVLAETTDTKYLLPIFEDKFPSTDEWHHKWWGIRARQKGDLLQFYIDDKLALEAHDPQPLPGGHVGIWTVDNGLLMPRVKIYYTAEKTGRDPVPGEDIQLPELPVEAPPAITLTSSTHPSIQNDFESSGGTFKNTTGDKGASLSLVSPGADGKGHCLALWHKIPGGDAGASMVEGRFDVREMPFLSFDYKLPSDAKINLYVTVGDKRYEIVFSGLKTPAPLCTIIGEVPGVLADEKWHHAQFNLLGALEAVLGPEATLQARDLFIGNFNDAGYLQAGFGGNHAGLIYYIDNFFLGKPAGKSIKMAVQPTAAVNGYGVSIDRDPYGSAPQQVTFKENAFTLNAKEDGTWYVHVRPQTTGGKWGDSRTYLVHAESAAPKIASTSPKAGDKVMSLPICLTFANPGVSFIDGASVQMKVNGAALALDKPGVSFDPQENTFRIDPGPAGLVFKDGQSVAVDVTAATDTAGNKLAAPVQLAFKASLAGDKIAPSAPKLTLPGYAANLVNDDFETSIGGWSSFGPSDSIDLSIDSATAPPGSKSSLRLYNREEGSSFGAYVRGRDAFDAGRYRYVSFDYKVPSRLRADLAVYVNGEWKAIKFKDNDDNLTMIGEVPNVMDDNEWHHADLDLYDMLRKNDPGAASYIVRQFVIADWNWKSNAQGQTYHLGNFHIAPIVSGAQPLTVKWSAYDAAGVTGVSYVLDESPATVPPQKVNATGSEFQVQATGDKHMWLHARAVDSAGNWGTTTHIDLHFSTSVPVAESVSPANSVKTATSLIAIKLASVGLAGLDPASLRLSVAGTEYTVSDSALTYNADTHTISWDAEESTPQPVVFKDGQTVAVKLVAAKDYAGNNVAQAPEWSWTMDYSKDRTPPVVKVVRSTTHRTVLTNTFTDGLGMWQNRGGNLGAAVTLDPKGGPTGGPCVKLVQQRDGGHMQALISNQPYSAEINPIISFDYKYQPNVKLDLLAYSEGNWYAIALSDDPAGAVGRVSGFAADGQWHHANIDLGSVIKRQNPKGSLVIEYLILSERNKLENPAGATAWFGDFVIGRVGRSEPVFHWEATHATGISGYSYVLDQNPATVPPEQVTSTDDTKKYDTLAPGVWYFHIRARDGAGNWGPTRTYGMLHMNVE
jgi:hypothetical protein